MFRFSVLKKPLENTLLISENVLFQVHVLDKDLSTLFLSAQRSNMKLNESISKHSENIQKNGYTIIEKAFTADTADILKSKIEHLDLSLNSIGDESSFFE